MHHPLPFRLLLCLPFYFYLSPTAAFKSLLPTTILKFKLFTATKAKGKCTRKTVNQVRLKNMH